MKKLLLKVAMMLVIFVGGSQYVMYLMTGKAPYSNFKMPTLSEKIPDLPSLPAKKEQAYKWTDKKGIVHYSSEPPPDESLATTIEVDPNTNLIQGIAPKVEASPEPAPSIEPLNGQIYTPGGIEKIMNDTKEAKRLLEQRNAEQEKILKAL